MTYACAGEVTLELHDVADVCAPEGVDRVVRHEPIRDEVVRALDVEVVDRHVEVDALDALDEVQRAELVHHDHPRPHGRRRHERKRVPVLRLGGWLRGQPGRETHGDVEHVLDVLDAFDEPSEVGERRLVPPPRRAAIRGKQPDARRLECAPALLVVPEERDPMLWPRLA
jgi:hypothetical protein